MQTQTLPTPTDVEMREHYFQKSKPKLCMLLCLTENSTLLDYERAWTGLSPYEKGAVFRRALAEGYWSSKRGMAEELGNLNLRDIGMGSISSLMQIAGLPAIVITAFRDPKSIKLLWGRRLWAAAVLDHDIVLSRAVAVIKRQAAGEKLLDAVVYKELIRGR